jgi:hypothetical protein
MVRKLNILAASLVALALLGALAVASASANYVSQQQTLVGHGTSTSTISIKTSVGTISCKTGTTKTHSEGILRADGRYTHERTTEQTTFSECTAFGFAATVKTTGCAFELLKPTSLKAPIKIVCEAGKQIEIVATGFCTMTIGSQSPGGTIAFTNEGSGSTATFKEVAAVTGIAYGGTCGSGTNGEYSGTYTFKGFTSEAMTTQQGVEVVP